MSEDITTDRRVELLEQSPLGRAVLATFAFDPSRWEPYTTVRSGSKHPKGTQGFRHVTSKKFITKEELPDDHVVHGKRIVRADEVPAVTVVALPSLTQWHPGPDSPIQDVQTEYNQLGAHGTFASAGHNDRLARLSLLAFARQQAHELIPEVRALIPQAERFADDPTPANQPDPNAAIRAMATQVGRFGTNHYVRNVVIPAEQPSVALGRHVRHSVESALQSSSTADHDRQRRQAHALRSIYYSSREPLTIPVNPQIRSLAKAAYDASDHATMKILADALEETGHAPKAALDNLRNPDAAVRGNWVLDHILGKR